VDAWLVWLIIAVVLAGAEAISLDLVLIMLAGGAAVGTASALVGLPVPVQILLAALGAAGLLLVVRPVAQRHLTTASHPTGTEALIGCEAIVLSRVDGTGGRVRLRGAEWSARALDDRQVIEVGSTVQVVEISGATALVFDHKQ
jgi:membrane protein implicated in regulation of membrane protease activity